MNHNHLSLLGAEALKTGTLILTNWQRLDFVLSNWPCQLLMFLSYLFWISILLCCIFHVRQVTALVTTNLNKIIDVNYYPVETAKRSNLRHRPIGLGVQGLADTFILLGMAFDSPEVSHPPSNFVICNCFSVG